MRDCSAGMTMGGRGSVRAASMIPGSWVRTTTSPSHLDGSAVGAGTNFEIQCDEHN